MQAVINKQLIKSLKATGKQYEVCDTKMIGFILRVNKTGKMVYVCQYKRGKRINIGSESVLTPTQARDRFKEIMADVVKGIDPMAEKQAAKINTYESYVINIYEPWVEAHHKDSKATIRIIKSNFFADFGKCKLTDITAWNTEKWRSKRLKAGTQPATTNRYLNAFKASLNRAVDWGMLKENPLSRVKQQKLDTNGVIRFLSDKEEARLRSALGSREERMRQERISANTWRQIRKYPLLPDLNKVAFCDYLKPIVLLDLNTGLRRGELFNLTWNDVDLERATFTVKGYGAKSGQTRHLPLNKEAVDVLYEWKAQNKDDGLVFPGQKAEKMTHIKSSWAKLLKDANITGFRFHDLRHTFASNLVMAGVDLNTVRELLGHSDIKMTLRYAHLAPAIKQAAVDRLVRSDKPDHL